MPLTLSQSSLLAPYRWTVDRYHRAVEAGVFEGQPLELLDGVLVEMSPEEIPHAGLSSDAADYLRAQLGNRAKVREAKPITLPNDSEPEPDIAIVRPLGEVYKTERHPTVADIFWVMEYANTSLEKDLEIKDKIYAAAGISEYWVVNLKARSLIVFRQPENGVYQSCITLTNGTLCPECFPDLSLDLDRLLR